MKSYVTSKKGSSAVFLSIVLSTLIALCFALIMAAREQTVTSRADALIHLAGESLLSEFHREISEEYGLFLLEGDERELTDHLRRYITPSLSAMNGVSVSGIRASGGRYAVVDPEPIRQQILSGMKAGGRMALPVGSAGTGQTDPAPTVSAADTAENFAANASGRHLRHGPTIASLPSRQMPEKDGLSDAIGRLSREGGLSQALSAGTEDYLLSSYILATFSSRRSERPEHFFRWETEYILFGKLSDEENARAADRALCTLRLPSNLAHIYADSAKRDMLAATAEAIAPGPAGAAVQALLAATWAWAESDNDVKLLTEGDPVPLVKSRQTWALDLDDVVKNLISGVLDPEKFESREDGSVYDPDPRNLLKQNLRVIRPEKQEGLSYEQYLRILLLAQDDQTTVMRALDLIQINIRRNTDGLFLISGQCTGVSLEMSINHRSFRYEKQY